MAAKLGYQLEARIYVVGDGEFWLSPDDELIDEVFQVQNVDEIGAGPDGYGLWFTFDSIYDAHKLLDKRVKQVNEVIARYEKRKQADKQAEEGEAETD